MPTNNTQVLGDVVVAATEEIWLNVLNELTISSFQLYEIMGETFNFFMEFTLTEQRTDMYVVRRVFDAFEEIDFTHIGSRKETLTVVSFVSGNQMSLRFSKFRVTRSETMYLCTELQKHLTDEILAWWDTNIYKGQIRLPVPYSDLKAGVTNDTLRTIQKLHGVGYELGGVRSFATHFSRSPHGLVHFSLNPTWIRILNDLIQKSFNKGDCLFFNEIVRHESFCLFFECDSKPIAKSGEYFATLIQNTIKKLSDQKNIPPIEDTDMLECHVFDASNATKTSYHVRFPRLQVTRLLAVDIVSKVKDAIEDVDVKNSIDLSPISGALVQLRMGLCDKVNKSGIGRANRPLQHVGTKMHQDVYRSPGSGGAATNADVLSRCSLHGSRMAKAEDCSTYLGCNRLYSGRYLPSSVFVPNDGEVQVLESIADADPNLKWIFVGMSLQMKINESENSVKRPRVH